MRSSVPIDVAPPPPHQTRKLSVSGRATRGSDGFLWEDGADAVKAFLSGRSDVIRRCSFVTEGFKNM